MQVKEEKLYVSRPFTKLGSFTAGVEGPACDQDGNLYAVNFEKYHTIGKVTPQGECSIFLELPDGSIGNGIRFSRSGDMFIADYTRHNILKVDMQTRKISVYAHEPTMHQPNDIAITANDTIFASDPDWKNKKGQIWRISSTERDRDRGRDLGHCHLLESGMGTANGIEVSPDEKTLYVNETAQRNIWAYDLSEDEQISNKRLFKSFPDFGLDGMRCDMAGNLYVARFKKGTVVQLSPQGELLREISLHGKNCTNLAFGGVDGRTCYVTVADCGWIEAFRTELPGRSKMLW